MREARLARGERRVAVGHDLVPVAKPNEPSSAWRIGWQGSVDQRDKSVRDLEYPLDLDDRACPGEAMRHGEVIDDGPGFEVRHWHVPTGPSSMASG